MHLLKYSYFILGSTFYPDKVYKMQQFNKKCTTKMTIRRHYYECILVSYKMRTNIH